MTSVCKEKGRAPSNGSTARMFKSVTHIAGTYVDEVRTPVTALIGRVAAIGQRESGPRAGFFRRHVKQPTAFIGQGNLRAR